MRIISFNTQGRELADTKLLDIIPVTNNGTPKDIDLILLQRCTKSFLTSMLMSHQVNEDRVKSWDGTSLHSTWTSSMRNNSGDQGLCVLSVKPISEFKVSRLDLAYDITDPHQCDVYQSFVFMGLRIINFLPPYSPEGVEYEYLDTLLQEDVDIMVGDCHNNYRNAEVHPAKFHNFRVANNMTNWADGRPHENDGNTQQLTWLFLRNEIINRMDNQWTLELESERVAQRTTSPGHSPSLYNVVMTPANGVGRSWNPSIYQ